MTNLWLDPVDEASFWPQGFWRVSDDRPIQQAIRSVGL
ncbi:hypothetical protein SAMN05216559_1892 [Halomicrobium zhouii]|uniref:Uncharacterized protein n=1 Tax=Halomicrobium zhouii TaxID=767519 RepID=A0A1I6L2H8_9EURY|nr:hypothetical protein SAMN05216559_1892 [Halomicrobium zhouii]